MTLTNVVDGNADATTGSIVLTQIAVGGGGGGGESGGLDGSGGDATSTLSVSKSVLSLAITTQATAGGGTHSGNATASATAENLTGSATATAEATSGVAEIGNGTAYAFAEATAFNITFLNDATKTDGTIASVTVAPVQTWTTGTLTLRQIIVNTSGVFTQNGGTTIVVTDAVGITVNGTFDSNGTVTGNVTFGSGLLSGYGTISGSVTASATSNHTIAPSAGLSSTATGTLTMGSLTTSSHTTLQFNLVTPTNAIHSTTSNSDTIAVTGTNGLVLNGGAIDLTNHATGAASLGFYKVISYSGTIGGIGLSSLTLPATANNVAYTFDATHDSGFVDIHRGYLGDVDDSGFVDINDLAILAANWQQPGGWSQGNFLGDPVVDINDLAILAANWQTGIASFGEDANSLGGTSESFQQAVAIMVFGGTSEVPEPASLFLLGLGVLGISKLRRGARS